MQLASFILLTAVAAALGFSHGPAPVPRTRFAVHQTSSLNVRMEEEAAVAEAEAVEEEAPPAPPAVEYSESLPFLVKRPQLAGYVGDVGFDPVGFSEILPMVHWPLHSHCQHE